MNRLVIVAFVGLGGIAHAQSPGINPEDAVAPTSVVEGSGIKVGEGTLLRPVLGIEAGVVSNVFYEEADTNVAGLLRLLVQIGTGSLSGQRLAPVETDSTNIPKREVGGFQYRADLRATYDYFPSGNDAINDQGGLGLGFLFRGIVRPEQPLQFAVVEDFSRELRPTNFESSESITRDINLLKLQLQWAPTGRSLFGVLHYENRIDVFERDTQQFANRFHNSLGLRVNWQWRPQTRIYADVTQGIYTGIGDSTKVTSFPLTTTAGIQTLITPMTTFVAHVGYGNGFYSSGPSYSAFLAGVQFGYRYSEVGRIAATYHYTHQDSINANFYRDHRFGINLQHGISPFLVLVGGELMLRSYNGLIVTSGPPDRNDVIGTVHGELRYNFRSWIAGSIDYRFSVVETDYMYDAGGGLLDNPSFTRHELLVGVRAAY